MSNFHTKDQLDQYFKKQGGYKTKTEREEFWDEDKLQSQVCQYLRENYPNLIFFSDMSGAHLSKRQAVKYSTLKSEGFKVPDMIFIGNDKRPNLYLELKKLGTTLYTRAGKFVNNEHYRGQAHSLLALRFSGGIADFSVGYQDTIMKINKWLDNQEFEYLLKNS